MDVQPLSHNPPPAYAPTAPVRPQAAQEAPSREIDARQRAQAPTEAKPSSREEQKDAVREATRKANTAIEGLRSDLKFTVDEETGIDVVKFIDVRTKEVIRQIPAQEMLEIAKRLDELRGLLIKDRA